jgi:alpha-glucoside transport system substrate-binding protein
VASDWDKEAPMRGNRGAVALAIALTLLAAACPEALDEDVAVGDPDAEVGEVTIMSALSDEEAEMMLATLADWAEDAGIRLIHDRRLDFERVIWEQTVDVGDPPDIALFPQPGLLGDMADHVRDLNEILDVEAVRDSLMPGIYELGEFDGRTLGVLYRLNLKSLVWHPVPEFADAGFEVPDTWDGLLELTAQIADDGHTPWCIGMEAGISTGWVATDWIEDLLLRTQPVEVYDAWVAGDLPFDSPEIREVAEMMAEIWFEPDYVRGGTDAIVTDNFGTAVLPMFEDPPECLLHRQAQFIEAFFPEEIQDDPTAHADFFVFPEVDPEIGTPALIAGDLVGLLTDNPAAEETMRHLTTMEAGEPWARTGAFLSPHEDFDADLYPTEFARRQAAFLEDAPYMRFDGSDMMPSIVGTEVFWVAMAEWVNGDIDLDTALRRIDQAWPD